MAVGDDLETLWPEGRSASAAAAARSGTLRRTTRSAGRPCPPALRGRRPDRRRRGGTSPRSRPSVYRRARSSTIAESTGPGSIIAGSRSASTSNAYALPMLIDVARQALQLDRRLRFVCDHLPDACQRRHRVEQPAHAGCRRAAEPGLELVQQHPALVVGACPHRWQIVGPRPGRPPTDATVPSGTGRSTLTSPPANGTYFSCASR